MRNYPYPVQKTLYDLIKHQCSVKRSALPQRQKNKHTSEMFTLCENNFKILILKTCNFRTQSKFKIFSFVFQEHPLQ